MSDKVFLDANILVYAKEKDILIFKLFYGD
jgi:hypothetical protein